MTDTLEQLAREWDAFAFELQWHEKWCAEHKNDTVRPLRYDGKKAWLQAVYLEGLKTGTRTVAQAEAKAKDEALEYAAQIADAHWPESGHVHQEGAVSCQMSISIDIRRAKGTKEWQVTEHEKTVVHLAEAKARLEEAYKFRAHFHAQGPFNMPFAQLNEIVSWMDSRVSELEKALADLRRAVEDLEEKYNV